MKTVTVEVTQADIDAEPEFGRWCFTCPLARAISRTLGRTVSVGLRTWGNDYQHESFPLPLDALNFRDKFDTFHAFPDKGGLKPFQFDLEVPE